MKNRIKILFGIMSIVMFMMANQSSAMQGQQKLLDLSDALELLNVAASTVNITDEAMLNAMAMYLLNVAPEGHVSEETINNIVELYVAKKEAVGRQARASASAAAGSPAKAASAGMPNSKAHSGLHGQGQKKKWIAQKEAWKRIETNAPKGRFSAKEMLLQQAKFYEEIEKSEKAGLGAVVSEEFINNFWLHEAPKAASLDNESSAMLTDDDDDVVVVAAPPRRSRAKRNRTAPKRSRAIKHTRRKNSNAAAAAAATASKTPDTKTVIEIDDDVDDEQPGLTPASVAVFAASQAAAVAASYLAMQNSAAAAAATGSMPNNNAAAGALSSGRASMPQAKDKDKEISGPLPAGPAITNPIMSFWPLIEGWDAIDEQFLDSGQQWRAANSKQLKFLDHIKTMKIKLFKAERFLGHEEFMTTVSAQHTVLNQKLGLLSPRFTTKFDAFEPRSFGWIGKLDLKVRLDSGEKVKIDADKTSYSGVKLYDRFEVVKVPGYPHPVIKIYIATLDGSMYITLADRTDIRGFDLIEKIEGIRTQLHYGTRQHHTDITFPCAQVDFIDNLEWLKNLATSKDNQQWILANAKQHIKVTMDEVDNTASTMQGPAHPSATPYSINGPFYYWMERASAPAPLFYAYSDPSTWQSWESAPRSSIKTIAETKQSAHALLGAAQSSLSTLEALQQRAIALRNTLWTKVHSKLRGTSNEALLAALDETMPEFCDAIKQLILDANKGVESFAAHHKTQYKEYEDRVTGKIKKDDERTKQQFEKFNKVSMDWIWGRYHDDLFTQIRHFGFNYKPMVIKKDRWVCASCKAEMCGAGFIFNPFFIYNSGIGGPCALMPALYHKSDCKLLHRDPISDATYNKLAAIKSNKLLANGLIGRIPPALYSHATIVDKNGEPVADNTVGRLILKGDLTKIRNWFDEHSLAIAESKSGSSTWIYSHVKNDEFHTDRLAIRTEDGRVIILGSINWNPVCITVQRLNALIRSLNPSHELNEEEFEEYCEDCDDAAEIEEEIAQRNITEGRIKWMHLQSLLYQLPGWIIAERYIHENMKSLTSTR